EEIIHSLEVADSQSLLENFQNAGRGDEFAVQSLKNCIQYQQQEEPVYSSVNECMDYMITLAEGYKTRGLALLWLGALGAPLGVGGSAYNRHRRLKTGEVWINPF